MALWACGSSSGENQDAGNAGASGSGGLGGSLGAGGTPALPTEGPAAGNPAGKCPVPGEAALENVSSPRTVVGDGTPQSCTSDAFVNAVAKGGVITFACGSEPKTIVLDRTAKIVNDTGPKIVIDGGSKITLSGGGKVRIIYQNTCDPAQKYTTDHCQDQDSPQLTLQNLTFIDGNAKGQQPEPSGGAVFVRGGRLKILNSRFFRNVCIDAAPDLGGGAVRVQSQFDGKPAYFVNSTFGGSEPLANVCSNGGAISGLGVSFTVINSLFSHNQAIGMEPPPSSNKGGGNGGAIYNDGNLFTLSLCGVSIRDNTANEGGGAIFYVSNDTSGSLIIKDSVLVANPNKGFDTEGYPGIFVKAKGGPQVSGSTIMK